MEQRRGKSTPRGFCQACYDCTPIDRIAVFDNDGTIWPEQPTCIQFIFAFDRLKSLALTNPALMKAEPFRTVLEGGLARLATLDEAGIIEIIKVTQSGMSTEQFSGIVAKWLDTARDQRFGRAYTDLVYQPMLELLDYLGTNEFKIFIVSGNGADSFASLPSKPIASHLSEWWGLRRLSNSLSERLDLC